MAIVTTIDAVRDWVEKEICSKVQLKFPDNDVVDEGYSFALVHPAAFSMYTPTDDKLPEGVESSIPSITIRITDGEDAQVFNMDAEGWRDAWNFVDTAVRIIENVEYLGGYRFMKERGLKFAPVASQEATPEYWPFWFANVEFYISEAIGTERKHVLYDNLL